jgi:DNA-binding beta-propeller fold protein YncE
VTRVGEGGKPTRPFRPQPGSTGRLPLAYGLGALWVGSQDGTLSRLDPVAHDRPQVIRLHTDPESVAVGAGRVWVAEASRDGVLQVDPRSGHVGPETPIGGRGAAISVGDGAVWVVTEADGHLWRIDPRDGSLTASIEVGGEPRYLAVTPASVWVATRQGIVTEIDPRTNRVERTVVLDHAVGGLTSGAGRLWVALA